MNSRYRTKKTTASIIALLFMLSASSGCSDENTSLIQNQKENNMFGFGNKSEERHVTSSPIEGRIFENGIPVSNARIVRKVRSNKHQDWVVEEFNTDESGFFSLPTREETYSLGLTQFVSATQIDVEINGTLINFWYSNNSRGRLYSEFGGAALENLICELTNEEIIINGDGYGILAKCTWSNMPNDNNTTDN
ncbi:MAG: DUF6795 domain-containing protein [Thalassolituus sp.]|uniref:DUF6795 domain-containing protein n=1 Tax=Thalassolituus sp. TaxID=2030822 RepID=UPI0039819614